jgi:hypothetical protein
MLAWSGCVTTLDILLRPRMSVQLTLSNSQPVRCHLFKINLKTLMLLIAHAIKTCPGGPTVPVKVGRKDSDTASPENLLPRGHAKSAGLIKQFALKGFSAIDLAALIGAHTVAKQRTTDPSQSGAPLDSTPGQWDSKYYSETLNGKAPFVLPSDKDVSQNVLTTGLFRTFASSQGAWAAAFVPAMEKLSMIGVDRSGLIDCTAALPGGSKKRDVRNAPLWDRLRW